VLLLDEPTNHLDVHQQLSLMQLVQHLPITKVIALHDLNQALACDRLAVMHQGRLVHLGPPDEVLTPELLQTVFQVQAHSLTDPLDGSRVLRLRPLTTPCPESLAHDRLPCFRLAALWLCCCAASGASAETVEVKMLNRGPHGAMVYEPEFIQAAPGDTIKFLATSNGHDAVSIAGMAPAGATAFRGKVNEEIAITLTQPGLYGIKCQPHYAMGMVMLVRVGDTPLAQLVVPEDVPEQARQRFENIVSRAAATR
jgi:pseudoazurin